MKKKVLRNVAIVSLIFIATFSIMLIVNYFQVRGATPLQNEVIETLKEINDQNANNPVLQEQIRQLDLMGRKAYFVRMGHLTTGVYILLGMLVLFIICTRLYFAKDKNIPDKDIDPIDEWAIKTNARKYIIWSATGLTAIALVFVLLSSTFLKQAAPPKLKESQLTAEVADKAPSVSVQIKDVKESATVTDEIKDTKTAPPDVNTETVVAEKPVPTSVVTPQKSAATHNAFRGNYNNGVSTAKGLPVQWDLGNMTNIAWKKEIPRKGFNSPVINGNKLFFSGADTEMRELYCYDLNTGEKLWSLPAINVPGAQDKLPEVSEDTGFAASTVATNGDKVCAIFATGDLICADMDGKLVWAKNVGVPDVFYGHASSLLIYNNLVFIQWDHHKVRKVFALDVNTGEERWNKIRNEKESSWSSPMIAFANNTPLLILAGNPSVTAYNPNTGDQLWRVECLSGEVAPSACSAEGVVYALNDYAKLVAINGIDGKILWESKDILSAVPSPVATKDNLYVTTEYGLVVSYSTNTGEMGKEHDLEGSISASPILAEGKIFQIAENGKVCIFSADDEFKLLHTFETGERTFATPAFTDGKIVIRTEKSLYCVAGKN